MMNRDIKIKDTQQSISANGWGLGNGILYEMCRHK
jgi:hypothetical protein